MLKNIIFDLDGTIVKSEKGIINGFKYVKDKFKIDIDDKYFKSFIGPPLKDSFEKYMNLKGKENEEAVTAFRDYYRTKGLNELEVYPHIKDCLKKLKEDNFNIYMATSKFEKYAREILKNNNIEKYFDFIAGASGDDSRSEKADVLAFLISSENLKREESLMVGDKIHDIEGARENKIKTLAVLYGYGNREEVKSADFIVEKSADLYQKIIYIKEEWKW